MKNVFEDQVLLNLLREVGVAYIDGEGAICTFEPENSRIRDIQIYLKSSSKFMNGRHLGIEPKVKVVPESDVISHFAQLTDNKSGALSKKDETDVAARLDRLLKMALDKGASDIHIVVRQAETFFIGRVDGKLCSLMPTNTSEYGTQMLEYAFVRKGKGSWSIKGDYDATFETSLAKDDDVDRPYNWRISQMPSEGGAKATIRNLDTGTTDDYLTLEQLGLTPNHVKYLLHSLNQSQGAIIVSGPTGSGKTTLVCSALLVMSEDEDRLIQTLEDPVEWQLNKRNIVQTTVDPTQKIGRGVEGFKDFAYWCKKLLRSDTDMAYIGETRDHNVAKSVLRMAETGQVAITTLHCNSAISAIGTLMEQMDINPALLASPDVIRCLAHQRLIRTICNNCGIEHREFEKKYENLNSSDKKAFDSVVDLIETHKQCEEHAEHLRDTIRYMNREGCPKCVGGEKGRTALFEIVLLDNTARDFIKQRDINGWEQHLKNSGWPSIRDHGRSKIFDGLADIRAVEAQVSSLNEVPLSEVYTAMRNDMEGGTQWRSQ